MSSRVPTDRMRMESEKPSSEATPLRLGEGRISCVRYADPNRAPYGWKNLLLPPKPAGAGP